MKRLQRAALLITLIKKLRERGSWCGETHIQKAAYFLETVCEVPLGHEFILYKHGPYSFDLCDELTALRVDGLLSLVVRHPAYRPGYAVTKSGQKLCHFFARTLAQNQSSINFIVARIGDMGVVALEKVATALYVTRERPNADSEARAIRIHELKPHIAVGDALDALTQVDALIKDSAALVS